MEKTKRKIFFRADAGEKIGYGHFIRTLALAEMLRDDFDCTFFSQSPSEYQQREADKVCPLIDLPSDNRKLDKFLGYLTGDEIVVLDNYFYTSDYQKLIKEKGCKLVCIDDMHDKHYYADVVINHGLTDKSLFDIEPYTHLCLGFNYALLRRPFLSPSSEKRYLNSWFISFGGTDYLNLTEKALKIIHEDPRVERITVVIGDAYQYKNNLRNYPKATILKNLTAEEMAATMHQSQYAILPSSSVCIEALACGCKVAAGYFVDNQIESANKMAEDGFFFLLGDLRKSFPTSFVESLSAFVNKNKNPFMGVRERFIKIFKIL